MTDGDALLAAIREFPDEDVPRLAFADWLDGQGEADRAEFIRVQVELGAAPTPDWCLDPWAINGPIPDGGNCLDNPMQREPVCSWCALRRRARALLVSHPAHPSWLGRQDPFLDSRPHRDVPGRGIAIRCHGYRVREVVVGFRRGFPEVVTCGAADLVHSADRFLAALPVREVVLTTWPAVTVTPGGTVTGVTVRAWGQPANIDRTWELPTARVQAAQDRTPRQNGEEASRWVTRWLLSAVWEGVRVTLPAEEPADATRRALAGLPWAIEFEDRTAEAITPGATAYYPVIRSGRLVVASPTPRVMGPDVGTRFGPTVATDRQGLRWRCEAILTNFTLYTRPDRYHLEAMTTGVIEAVPVAPADQAVTRPGPPSPLPPRPGSASSSSGS